MNCHQHKNEHSGQFKSNECLRCHQDGGVVKLTKSSVRAYHGPTSTFPLERKHKSVPCVSCHKNNEYLPISPQCGTCHEDKLHKGSLGDNCNRCHKGGAWKALAFDHNIDTSWKLEGFHTTFATCAECHEKRDYSNTPTECAGCHLEDDPHSLQLGTDCENCHKEDGSNHFDHNTQSVFPIKGKHQERKCSDYTYCMFQLS